MATLDGNEKHRRSLYTKDGFRIPGTQHLVDIDASDKRGTTLKGEVILIPKPSSDPNDPLNWSTRRKAVATSCWVLYTVVNGIAGSNLSSVLIPFSKASGLSPSVLNAGTGYLFLLAGWSLLFWQPLALQYGKRLVYIASLLGLTGMSVWAPFITSSGSWYARSILTGFFAAPIEALPELSLTDLFFTHQRGTYMGLYAFVLVGSNFFSPFICGFINNGQGYQWVFYWPAIFCFVAAIVLFFAMDETNYNRPLASDSALETLSEKYADATMASAPADHSASHGKGASWKRLSLITLSHPFQFHHNLYRQIIFFTYPLTLYAGWAYGSTLIWFNVLNATASSVYSMPPYNFSTTIVGTTYLSPLLGSALGMIFTGRLSDRLILYLARRNGGIMEPEMRLYLLAVTTLLIPFSLLLWGVGAADSVHWFGLVFAMALLAFNNTCGASLSVAYCIDCYRERAGSALTPVICVRNTMSFAIGYGINPWIEGMGMRNAFITAAFVGMAFSALFMLVIWKGKRERERNAKRYSEMIEGIGRNR